MADVQRLERRRGAAPRATVAVPRTRGGPAPESPADLLARYRPGEDVFWSAPGGTLLARGVAEQLGQVGRATDAEDPADPSGLADAVAARLREVAREQPARPAVAVGALPFDPRGEPALVLPRSLTRAPGRLGPAAGVTAGAEGSTAAGAGAPAASLRERPTDGRSVRSSEDSFRASVRAVLDLLAATGPDRPAELEKVVLARALDLRAPRPLDVAAVLAALAGRDPHARLFAVPLPTTGPETGPKIGPGAGDVPRTLVGASPELLVARRGTRVSAMPLAGSAARHPDPEVDAARAQALLTSDKDRREHGYVVRSIVEALAPLCRDLVVPAEPTLVATPTVWHLATRVEAAVVDPATTALHLALRLHPTPAVAGVPTAAARALISRLEPVDRGYYAGAVGWCDAAGDGEWAVSIRCGVVEGATVRLHAGAGVVRGSDPDAELAETGVKLATLRTAVESSLAATPG